MKKKYSYNGLTCPTCGSSSLIKKGTRKNKFKNVQLYLCKECGKRFADGTFKNKTYAVFHTVKALSVYNSGMTIDETAQHTKIPRSTVANWLKEYKTLFNLAHFSRELQVFAQTEKVITGHKYIHELIYVYLQHNFKLDTFIKNSEPKLYSYLQSANNGEINKEIFQEADARASQIKLHIFDELTVKKTNNNACKFAKIAIALVDSNYKRHWAVEKTMLENDTSTIATEVPVYVQLSNSTIPWISQIQSKNDYITGHIDLLQYRNKKLYILDYKPGAAKEKPLGQLFMYACCLSKSTGIHFSKMKLAWFDDTIYYEVDAMEVYKIVMKRFAGGTKGPNMRQNNKRIYRNKKTRKWDNDKT